MKNKVTEMQKDLLGDEFVESENDGLLDTVPSPVKIDGDVGSPGISPRTNDGPSTLQRTKSKFMNTANPPTEDQYKEIFNRLFAENIKSEPFRQKVLDLVKDHLPKDLPVTEKIDLIKQPETE